MEMVIIDYYNTNNSGRNHNLVRELFKIIRIIVNICEILYIQMIVCLEIQSDI